LNNAAKLLYLINFNINLLPEGYLMINERERRYGWGIYVINPSAKSDLLIEIPAPVEEWGICDAGVTLFTGLGARAMAVAGSARTTSPDGSSDALANQSTMFGIFHKVMGSRGILQVRGSAKEVKAISNNVISESKERPSRLAPTTL